MDSEAPNGCHNREWLGDDNQSLAVHHSGIVEMHLFREWVRAGIHGSRTTFMVPIMARIAGTITVMSSGRMQIATAPTSAMMPRQVLFWFHFIF
jgi:hypothetical protein